MIGDTGDAFFITPQALCQGLGDLRPELIGQFYNPLRFLPLQQWHEAYWLDHWDCNRIHGDHKQSIIYSYSHNDSRNAPDAQLLMKTGIYKLGENLYFAIRTEIPTAGAIMTSLHVWGAELDPVESTIADFRKKYTLRAENA